MKKIILSVLLISFVHDGFLFANEDTSAQVSLPFEIYDNAGGQRTLYFGLDQTATDSIDLQLGEEDLPPFPPTGVFEARWILPKNGFNGSLSSYLDYRFTPGFPFTDSVEHRIKYQGADGADTMFFSWDFPPEITALMQDLVTGTVVNVPMSGIGVFGFTDFVVLDQMKFTVYYDAVVPVELISFGANVFNGSVKLQWSTATETNNSGFKVERSKDNNTFSEIGFVPGFGTTTEPKSYSFTDQSVNSGKYYYRLRQIDYDGTFEYSNVVQVEIKTPATFRLAQNYPNPFNPSTKISFSLAAESEVKLKIFNIVGEEIALLINNNLEAGLHSVDFVETAELSSGIYLYKIEARGKNGTEFIDVKKMMILK